MKKLRNDFCCWLAWKLPRGLVYWAAIRLMAHASHVHANREMHSLSPVDCLKAWETKA